MATGNPVKIRLFFKRHCIETAAQKEYEKRIREYFKQRGVNAAHLENEIRVLKYFLETADFKVLRNQCNQTAEQSAFLICMHETGNIHLQFNRTTILITCK